MTTANDDKLVTYTGSYTDAGGYEWGRTAKLRAYRDYMGLTTGEFAERLGMSKRSYQRMETGETAIRPGLWDTVNEVLAEFKGLVQTLLDTAVQHAIGPDHPSGPTIPCEFDLDEDSSGWARAITAHAMIANPFTVLPMVQDDRDAIAEMKAAGDNYDPHERRTLS